MIFRMRCKYCNTEAKAGMKFCPKCGKELFQLVTCNHCGAQIKAGLPFCPNCGAKQNEQIAEPELIPEVASDASSLQDEVAEEHVQENIQGVKEPEDTTATKPSISKTEAAPSYKENQGSKKWLWIVGVILLLGILGGGGYYFMSNASFLVLGGVGNDVDTGLEEKNEEIAEVDTLEVTTIYDNNGEAIYSFSGEVVNNQPNGYGVLTYLRDEVRDRYEGNMVNGQCEDNSAALFYKNGDIFRGAFKNDQFEIGTYYVDDSGEYFRGIFKNNKPWKGFWYDAHDNVISRVENGRAK